LSLVRNSRRTWTNLNGDHVWDATHDQVFSYGGAISKSAKPADLTTAAPPTPSKWSRLLATAVLTVRGKKKRRVDYLTDSKAFTK
jgi:hypothetical protein